MKILAPHLLYGTAVSFKRALHAFLLVATVPFIGACAGSSPEAGAPAGGTTQALTRSDSQATPIGEAPGPVQDWASAVTYLRFAEGGCGTGFFIAPDGTFLTNEHLLSRRRCTRERCAGVQLIRGFSRDGAMETYDKVSVLAQNDQMDFAIGKVELPPGKTVPFLKLSPGGIVPESEMVIIGHPHCGTLHASEARYEDQIGATAYLKGALMPGGEGSPVLDRKTGHVVGLYTEEVWERASRHYGKATDVAFLTKLWTDIYVLFTGEGEINYMQFAAVMPDVPQAQRVVPQTRAERGNSYTGVHALVGQAMTTDREPGAWRTELDWLDGMVVPGEDREILANAWIDVGVASNRVSRAPVEVLDKFLKDLGPCDGATTCTRLSVHSGRMSRKDCAERIDAGNRQSRNLRRIGYYCLSRQAKNGDDLLKTLFDLMPGTSGDYRSFQGTLENAYWIIRNQAELQTLTAEEVSHAQRILKIVAEQSTSWALGLQAEALSVLLQRDPALVGPGSFFETF